MIDPLTHDERRRAADHRERKRDHMTPHSFSTLGAGSASPSLPAGNGRTNTTRIPAGDRGLVTGDASPVMFRAEDEERMAERIAVHDPRGYPPKVVGKRLAPRLHDLDGRTVYLVDCLFDNSQVFMDQLRDWFAEHLPDVHVRTIRPRETWADDEEMRATIRTEGDAAILGVGL
jgi:hypothetical protein